MEIAPINLLFESALIVGSVCLSLSVLVLAHGLGHKLHLAYSALAFNISVWALSFFISEVLGLRAFESIHIIANLLLAPTSMYFMKSLLRPQGAFFQWLTRISFLLALLLIPLVTFGLDRHTWIRDASYFSPGLIIFAVLYLYLSEALGMVNPRNASLSKLRRKDFISALRRRNMGIYLGGTILTVICSQNRVSILGEVIPSIGNFLLAVYMFFLKDIVLQQEYASLRRLVGAALADNGAAVAVMLVFLITTVWVRDDPVLFVLNTFLAAYIATMSIAPFRKLLVTAYERVFFKEAKRLEISASKAVQELATVFDRKSIVSVTKDYLRRSLYTRIVSLYLLDEEGKQFVKFYDATVEHTLPQTLSLAYPLVQHWQRSRDWKPVLVSEMEAASDYVTGAARSVAVHLTLESLQRLDSSLALPFIHERRVLGFCTLAPKGPPGPWRSSWGILPLLEPFFRKSAQAINDLDVYSQLREKDRLAVLGEMSAGLAHEIRNPLGAIKGAAQVMKTHRDDPPESMVDIIIEEVDRLDGVVTQFLNYSKPFKGESRFTDLRVVIESAIRRFNRQRNRDLEIELELHLAEELPPAFCQPDLISQVISNLLDNAREALREAWAKNNSKDGSPKLHVTLEAENNSQVSLFTITVQDNGIGIKKEYLDKVFIPFFTSSKNGTGLGLPICQRIAEAHGGRMEINSDKNRGTTAVLRFPSRLEKEMSDGLMKGMTVQLKGVTVQ